MEKGIVTPEYFLDKMKGYELSIYCDALHLKNRDAWEQARLVAYLIAQSNSTKRLKPTDILKFPWEEQKKKQAMKPKGNPKPMTLEQLEEIKAQAKIREEKLKKEGLI